MNCQVIHSKTVIIGSGVSGISTASSLLKNDYSDFLVFEAMDRIGGRCHTIDFNNSFLEFGAQFIHGQSNNPIFYIARENKQIDEKFNRIIINDDEEEDSNGINIELNSSGRNSDSLKYLFVSETGVKIDLQLANKIYQICNKAVRLAEDFAESYDTNLLKDTSVADYMLEKYNELIQSNFHTELQLDTNNELKKLIEGFFVWRCKCENVENGCDSMFKVSLNNYNTFEELKGSQIIQTNYGYKSILNLILENHRAQFNSRLHLNHALRKIFMCKRLKRGNQRESKCEHCVYTKNVNKVVLLISDMTNRESNRDFVVVCDNVVCTMSLGFLKENLKKIIEPVTYIPNEKLLAVSRLGFDTINKIFLIYDKPFWNDELVGIYPINFVEKNQSIFTKLNDRHYTKVNWFENICYFEPGKDNKNVLCAWISGCRFVENLSSDTIIKDCTEYLRKILGRSDIPEANSILKSTWGSNDYFKGSYSFPALGSYSSDFRCIGNPIYFNNRPLVMFAGEATIRKYYSTVHGAYISGEREAQRILLNLNYNQKMTKN